MCRESLARAQQQRAIIARIEAMPEVVGEEA